MKTILSVSTAILLLLGAMCGSPKNALKPTDEINFSQAKSKLPKADLVKSTTPTIKPSNHLISLVSMR